MFDFVRRLLRRPILWQLALTVYWLVLVISTHVPKDTPLVPGGSSDKLVHFAAFALLAGLFATTWQVSAGWLTVRHLRWAWIAIVLFAAMDEMTQPLFGREASAADWLADAAGAFVGLLVFQWCRSLTADSKSSGPPFGPTQGTSRRGWLRFSLKTLLIVATVVAFACYWLMLPSLNAQRFAAAIRTGDYEAAERMFPQGAEVFPGSWKEHQYFKPIAHIDSLTWRELIQGERQVTVGISYGDDDGIAHCAGKFTASRSGLQLTIFLP